MDSKSRSVWRMAFRSGSRGEDHWERCFELGLAAIACGDLPDLSDIPEEQFDVFFRDYCLSEWGELPGTALQGSFRKFKYHMNEGDTIYAKSGTWLVGKGRIVGAYQYRRGILRKRGREYWAHYRKAKWEKNFSPISKDKAPKAFEAPLHTVLQLKGVRLDEVCAAEEEQRGR